MKHEVALTAEELPLACTLTAPELVTRGAEIDDLFTGVQQTEELTDGYALRFPGSPTWAERLLSFIQGERSCCLFFTFELVFQPNQGPIWLHIRGPEGVKGMVRETLSRQRTAATAEQEQP